MAHEAKGRSKGMWTGDWGLWPWPAQEKQQPTGDADDADDADDNLLFFLLILLVGVEPPGFDPDGPAFLLLLFIMSNNSKP